MNYRSVALCTTRNTEGLPAEEDSTCGQNSLGHISHADSRFKTVERRSLASPSAKCLKPEMQKKKKKKIKKKKNTIKKI